MKLVIELQLYCLVYYVKVAPKQSGLGAWFRIGKANVGMCLGFLQLLFVKWYLFYLCFFFSNWYPHRKIMQKTLYLTSCFGWRNYRPSYQLKNDDKIMSIYLIILILAKSFWHAISLYLFFNTGMIYRVSTIDGYLIQGIRNIYRIAKSRLKSNLQ